MAGRGGALGDVRPATVAAALGFIADDAVRDGWDTARRITPPSQVAAQHLAECCRWGRENLDDFHGHGKAEQGAPAHLALDLDTAAFKTSAWMPSWSTGAVPGGSRCRLRLIASAELASVDVISAPFPVPLTPREVTIVALEEGQLAASAYSPDAGVCPPDELRWSSDLDGDLGTGRQPAVPPSSGRHRITATAPDGTGGAAIAAAWLTVP